MIIISTKLVFNRDLAEVDCTVVGNHGNQVVVLVIAPCFLWVGLASTAAHHPQWIVIGCTLLKAFTAFSSHLLINTHLSALGRPSSDNMGGAPLQTGNETLSYHVVFPLSFSQIQVHYVQQILPTCQ